jgi:hypothetical protein
MNTVVGSGLQLTERILPETVEVHPVGGVLVTESVTVPVKPFMLVTVIVEVPAVVAVVRRIVEGLADNEKSWTVTLTVR